jgi:uncharacterized protein (TIGR03435 family)
VLIKKPKLTGMAALWIAANIALAQTPPAGPSFEVASIKPAEPITPEAFRSGRIRIGMKVDGARVDFGGMPLTELLRAAFGVKPYQISGPDWMGSQRFDIVAKLPDGATQDQVPAMLQALLVERFKLAFHRENHEHPMYALVVAKGGPKLKEAEPDADTPPPAAAESGRGSFAIQSPDGGQMVVTPGGQGRGATVTSKQFGTMRISAGQDGAMHMEASKTTLANLADMLSTFVDRPVVDQTELKGAYQVTLDLSIGDLMNAARARGLPMGPGMPMGPGAMPAVPIAGGATGGPMPAGAAGAAGPVTIASDPSGGSIFTALQKLGLKLEPRKAPVETIVVDHLEKTPTEN